ncbi:hypothetical protein L1987_85112 [Smallanthus sonchifolius]|uniref:Uncharacterized protein n=1 Tax=Smallanthus sonchifolius TaxID=185202 RepID=A0ACB8XVI3_9ASTR|nr:hypothetical protein L1987_85112 [Smallanthus sonchifolius]
MDDAAKTIFKFISSRYKSFSKYEENINELREEIANLTNKKMAIEEDVTLAKLEGEVPTPQVNEWLMKVSRAEDDVRSLLEMADGYADARGFKMMQCWTVAKTLNLVKELNSTRYEKTSAMMEMAVPPLVGQGAIDLDAVGIPSRDPFCMTLRHLLSLSSLISLTISNCNDIAHLISKERSPREVFPNLKHLVLEHLQSLETIVEGIIPRSKCLRNLTTIQVLDCPMLKGVVSYAMLRHVKKLEDIKVSGCENLSCIIESGEHEETLPNLRILEMHNMANLRIAPGVDDQGNLTNPRKFPDHFEVFFPCNLFIPSMAAVSSIYRYKVIEDPGGSVTSDGRLSMNPNSHESYRCKTIHTEIENLTLTLTLSSPISVDYERV